MLELHTPPSLPLVGFALYENGRLLVQGGSHQPLRCNFCRPDQLSSEAYKQLVWLIEDSLGANRNDLAQTDPSSICALLRVIVLCHANRRPDPFTGAVLAWNIAPPSPFCFSMNEQPSGRSLRKPVARFLSGAALPAGVHPAGVDHLVPLPEAGRPAVA